MIPTIEQQPAISATLLSPGVRQSEKVLCTLTDADITVAEDIVKPWLQGRTLVLHIGHTKNSQQIQGSNTCIEVFHSSALI